MQEIIYLVQNLLLPLAYRRRRSKDMGITVRIKNIQRNITPVAEISAKRHTRRVLTKRIGATKKPGTESVHLDEL